MKNWVVKLLLLLFIPSLLGLAFTALFQSFLNDWMLMLSYAFAPLLSVGIAYFFFTVKWEVPFWIFITVVSATFNVPLQNWLFHSADDIVRYASVNELSDPMNNALYFTFDTLEIGRSQSSSVLVTRTQSSGRHGRQLKKVQKRFGVIPVFSDSLPKHKYAEREVKAWITFEERAGSMKNVVCYEHRQFDISDYQEAMKLSSCKLQRPTAPLITPLYHQFITRTEWRGYFLQLGGIAVSSLLLLGMIMNYLRDRKR